MKTMLLILFCVLPAPTPGQAQKPRVSIAAQDGELARLLGDELRTGSNVALTTAKRGDYVITAAIAPLGEDVGCRGVIGVLLIEGRDGRQLSAFIASDVGALARQMAQGFNKELQPHRGK